MGGCFPKKHCGSGDFGVSIPGTAGNSLYHLDCGGYSTDAWKVKQDKEKIYNWRQSIAGIDCKMGFDYDTDCSELVGVKETYDGPDIVGYCGTATMPTGVTAA